MEIDQKNRKREVIESNHLPHQSFKKLYQTYHLLARR